MFKPPRKTTFITLASIVTCVLGLAQSLQGAGRYLQVEYPPATAADELQVGVTYILWIPDGAPRLRGVIVHQHGAGLIAAEHGAGLIAAEHGATAAYDLHWQALAKKWDCALLGPSYHVLNEKTDTSPGGSELWFDPRRGSDKVFLKALSELAAKSGHSELQTVPWVLWGHSGGGIWSNVMTILHPERVAAAFLRSGSAASFRNHPEFPQPQVPAAVYSVPTMCNAGVKEKREGAWNGAWDGGLATFQEYRAQGAPNRHRSRSPHCPRVRRLPLSGYSVHRCLSGHAIAQ